jgi:hypothetical protein
MGTRRASSKKLDVDTVSTEYSTGHLHLVDYLACNMNWASSRRSLTPSSLINPAYLYLVLLLGQERLHCSNSVTVRKRLSPPHGKPYVITEYSETKGDRASEHIRPVMQ